MAAITREHGLSVLHLRPALAFGYLVVAAAVGYGAYAYLLQRVRPALATSNAYVNPVIAVALGAAFAGERISVLGLAALLLILSGVALTAFSEEAWCCRTGEAMNIQSPWLPDRFVLSAF